MDVKQASRKKRGVSRPASPPAEPQPEAAAPTPPTPEPTGKSRWKHDLHRSFARIRLDLPPTAAHVWEIMWDHLPAGNIPFHVSDDTIAREGDLHRTKACKALNDLTRRGLLVCVRRGRRGSREASVWRFPESLPDVPKRRRRKPPARPPA